MAQIIDYAKELTEWSYDELDRCARTANGSSLWELVQGVADEDAMPSEAAFVDEVTKNL